MIGPALAAGAFAALLALGWWNRRRVPLLHVFTLQASAGGRRRRLDVQFGGSTLSVWTNADNFEVETRRTW